MSGLLASVMFSFAGFLPPRTVKLEKLQSSSELLFSWVAPHNVDLTRAHYFWICTNVNHGMVEYGHQNETQIEILGPFSPGEMFCEVEARYSNDSQHTTEIGRSQPVRSNSVSIPYQRKSIAYKFPSACVHILWTKHVQLV